VTGIISSQYGVGMGIYLDLDGTGAPALDLLAVDLPFTCCLFYIMLFPPCSIVCTTEYLAL
jgi:hypothetical protein